MKRIAEICCGSYDDACAAAAGGAGRIELNSALFLGGLTPSLQTLRLVRKNLSLKVVAMVRPRGAGFCYTNGEFETMLGDCALLMENGADGIAFGCLKEDGAIDAGRNQKLVDTIHRYGGEAVFHRAFDCVKDPCRAMETLISLGADRVLTSGLQDKAPDGAPLLRKLQKRYGNKIQLLAGSGLNAGNVRALMEQTGVLQVHSSCREWRKDPTTAPGSVSYAYAPVGGDYEAVSEELVRAFVKAAQGD